MAQFPSLVPSEAPITPGAWPVTATISLNGAESRIRHGSAQIGRRLRLTFTNITEADFLAILAHYRGQRSGFDPFGFDTTTLAADLTQAGHAWLYASPPQVTDEHADCFTVACEFKSEPRGLVVAPGKAWRSLATLNPGARDGGIVYGPSIAWVTATTFLPGSRVVATPDPYFASVVLLCGFDGVNGSSSFVDEGPLGLSLSGDATISTAQSVFGGSSLRLNGSTTVTLPSNSALTMTGDFTFDARCRFDENRQMRVLAKIAPPINDQLYRDYGFNGNGIAARVTSGASTTIGFPFDIDTWYALRWARSGSTMYFFVDGVLIGTATRAETLDFSGGIIGDSFLGYMDEIRLTTVCRSTASYTVDTAKFPRF